MGYDEPRIHRVGRGRGPRPGDDAAFLQNACLFYREDSQGCTLGGVLPGALSPSSASVFSLVLAMREDFFGFDMREGVGDFMEAPSWGMPGSAEPQLGECFFPGCWPCGRIFLVLK